MGNHFHLAIKVNCVRLSSVMQRILPDTPKLSIIAMNVPGISFRLVIGRICVAMTDICFG